MSPTQAKRLGAIRKCRGTDGYDLAPDELPQDGGAGSRPPTVQPTSQNERNAAGVLSPPLSNSPDALSSQAPILEPSAKKEE